MGASDKGKQSMGGTLSRQPETDADEVFLHSLYTGTRAPELALIPWDDAAKAAFLHQQFDAQRVHYRCEFSQADFDVLLRGGSPLGRLYLDRSGLKWRLLDIALVSDRRGRGLGPPCCAPCWPRPRGYKTHGKEKQPPSGRKSLF